MAKNPKSKMRKQELHQQVDDLKPQEVRIIDLSEEQARARAEMDPQPPSDDRERLLYDGESICEYVLSPVDDVDQRYARIVGGCSWEDLRNTPASQLPEPVSKVYNVWEVVRAANKPLYLSSSFLGMVYSAPGGREVLTNAVLLPSLALNTLIAACGRTPTPPANCPTYHPISGTGKAWSSYKTSSRAAKAAAEALVPDRASTDAGLEMNAFTCPHPNCQNKRLARVTSTVVNSDASLSLTTSAFYLEWRYSGWAEYSWAGLIKCS